MATTFPTSLQDLDATRGTTGQPLSTPSHITHHLTEDDTIEALQAKVGANSSAVTTSLDYKLSGVTGTTKAVPDTNGTLTTPAINVGSDATGDILYRHSDGKLKRLAVSTDGKILKLASGVPSWATETVVADASTTEAGIVEEATLDEINANTGDGALARLFVNPSTLGKTIDGTFADNSDAKIPSQKAIKTYVDTKLTFKNGTTTKDASEASTTQNIAHGLGRIPQKVRIIARSSSGAALTGTAETVYNGTTQSSNSVYNNGGTWAAVASFYLQTGAGGGQTSGVVTFDATNIIITWTKSAGTITGTYQIMWEAQ